MIKENIISVRNNIKDSCEKASRNYDDVTLIAVSKTKPIGDLIEAYEAGARDFGENKVQEIMDKFDLLPSDARFHMIGHLQKNKVKYIVGKVYLIHSVDSYELAKVIQKESEKKNVHTDILLEVNISAEESKYGLDANSVIDNAKKISELNRVHIKGLMTVAPYVVNPEDNRQYFVALKQIGIDINSQNIDNVSMDILSMGMTGDYMVAIEEGATMVRVGTGIFGERNYNI